MPDIQHDATELRAFNSFYTRHIGVLRQGLLGSPLSLTQVRVLYELSARKTVVASQLARDLGLDTGYLSRLLSGFRRKRWIALAPSSGDRRRRPLALTPLGRAAFEPLDRRSQAEAASAIAALDDIGRRRLLEAAISCLNERGYTGTTTTEIAGRAGVSRGAQVHHFRHKEELVIGALDHICARRMPLHQAHVCRPAHLGLIIAARPDDSEPDSRMQRQHR